MTVKTGAMPADKNKEEEKKEESLFDLIIVLIEAIAIAIALKTFVFAPFNIPSPSMVPNLLVGDYLFVSKFSYGYSRYSFPGGLNLFSGRFFFSEPKRGDVIVFKWPYDNSTDYIKRLIGLPGDKIQLKGGVVYVNDAPLKRERIEDREMDTKYCGQTMVHQYRETNPEGRDYIIQKISETCRTEGMGRVDDTDAYYVPPGHYFMMGDNRDDSADSRYEPTPTERGVGYVPRENLVGRARFLFFSIDEKASWFKPWRWPAEIRWSRLGKIIH